MRRLSDFCWVRESADSKRFEEAVGKWLANKGQIKGFRLFQIVYMIAEMYFIYSKIYMLHNWVQNQTFLSGLNYLPRLEYQVQIPGRTIQVSTDNSTFQA